jgi:hypothetical protein
MLLFSLDINTMFGIRTWERFQFMIEYEAHQVWSYCIPIKV